MSLDTLTIATRQSPLALRQTEIVNDLLSQIDPELRLKLLPMQTSGDKFLQSSLAKIGGKGLFVKELETALLSGEASMAVHSMKDLPHTLPEGLMLSAILPREDCRDAFISHQYSSLSALPEGAKVGTSSLRRQAQIKAIRPDIEIIPLRGNIQTRLKKSFELDAIVLAAAGLKRMELDDTIKHYFTPKDMLPAAGQGALGIECRVADESIQALLQQLVCPNTTACVIAERALTRKLNGSCQVPIAAHATLTDKSTLHLDSLVATPDGKQILRAQASAARESAEELGLRVAEDLLNQGAQEILDNLAH